MIVAENLFNDTVNGVDACFVISEEQTRELLWPAVPAEADLAKYKRMVAFVGKYAEWKRQAALLHAAAAYEKDHPDVVTFCVGTGPDDEKKKIINLCEKLGLKNT